MSTATNTLPGDSQAIPATKRKYKPRSTIKSQAIQNAVIAKHVAGTSKLQISKDLQLAPNTVSSILDLSNVDEVMGDGRLQTLRRVPAALRTLDARLEKNSENAALWLLDKCFESSKIGSKQPNTQLVVAIQNLMQPTTGSVPADNSAEITVNPSQVVENKQ
jgi:hypothetical protein